MLRKNVISRLDNSNNDNDVQIIIDHIMVHALVDENQ